MSRIRINFAFKNYLLLQSERVHEYVNDIWNYNDIQKLSRIRFFNESGMIAMEYYCVNSELLVEK